MGSANGIAAIGLGAFVLYAVLRSKDSATKFLTMLAGEVGFIKWGIAASLVWFLATRSEIGGIGRSLIALTVLGLAIKVADDPAILQGITALWKAIPDAVPAKG